MIPTPPAIKTKRSTSETSIRGGGHVKLPPTLTASCAPKISSRGLHSHCAGGFVLFCTASSRNGAESFEGRASLGVDVIVKPPALGSPGINVSSHCPGRNFTGGQSVLLLVAQENKSRQTLIVRFGSTALNLSSLMLSLISRIWDSTTGSRLFSRGSAAVLSS